MKIEIEKNIPIPPKRMHVVGKVLSSLIVDESALFPVDVLHQTVRNQVVQMHKTTAMRFITRTIDGRIRVWRTK